MTAIIAPKDMIPHGEHDAPTAVYDHTDLELDRRQAGISTHHTPYEYSTPGHTAPAFPDARPPAKHVKRRVCGFTKRVCIAIAGLLTLLIAVAVGGGVGGSVMVRRCEARVRTLLDSSSSSNSTTTTTAPAVPDTGCPDVAGTSYTTASRHIFVRRCASVGSGRDMIGVVVASWELCMEACGNRNDYAKRDPSSGNQSCVGNRARRFVGRGR